MGVMKLRYGQIQRSSRYLALIIPNKLLIIIIIIIIIIYYNYIISMHS